MGQRLKHDDVLKQLPLMVTGSTTTSTRTGRPPHSPRTGHEMVACGYVHVEMVGDVVCEKNRTRVGYVV
jgi:hypothetical protein